MSAALSRDELAFKVAELMREYDRTQPRSLNDIVATGIHFPFRATTGGGYAYLISPASDPKMRAMVGPDHRLDFTPLDDRIAAGGTIANAAHGGPLGTWFVGPWLKV